MDDGRWICVAASGGVGGGAPKGSSTSSSSMSMVGGLPGVGPGDGGMPKGSSKDASDGSGFCVDAVVVVANGSASKSSKNPPWFPSPRAAATAGISEGVF